MENFIIFVIFLTALFTVSSLFIAIVSFKSKQSIPEIKKEEEDQEEDFQLYTDEELNIELQKYENDLINQKKEINKKATDYNLIYKNNTIYSVNKYKEETEVFKRV
jgi:hypothetical protein